MSEYKKCNGCKNTGLIFYYKVFFETKYQYVARCICGYGDYYNSLPNIKNIENALIQKQ